jgi:hypothetical protein
MKDVRRCSTALCGRNTFVMRKARKIKKKKNPKRHGSSAILLSDPHFGDTP